MVVTLFWGYDDIEMRILILMFRRVFFAYIDRVFLEGCLKVGAQAAVKALHDVISLKVCIFICEVLLVLLSSNDGLMS